MALTSQQDALTPQQVAFFETFGYIVLPGAVKDDIDWITEEFKKVFEDRGVVHDGTKRSCIVPFIDQREKLCTLLDHPNIEGAATSLLGENFNYVAGDGNYYNGETGWHPDGEHSVGRYLKIAFYLDKVTRETGALRVIPGSQRMDGDNANWAARQARHSQELWGIAGKDVPSVALESQPGDVVMFNHNLMHASFGGSGWRRMFTMNLCAHCDTPEEIEEMRNFNASMARFWCDQVHSQTMRDTASPGRMTHLQQVIDNEDHLPALAAEARRTMSEPARG